MELEDRIKEAWDKICIGLVPCHNPDVILRVLLQNFLQDMIYAGEIVKWKDIDVKVVRHSDYYVASLSVTIQPTRAFDYFVLETVFMGMPAPPKPRNPDERFNFDE